MGLFDDIGSAVSQGAQEVGGAVSQAGQDVLHGAEDVGAEIGHGYNQVTGAFGGVNRLLGGPGFGQIPTWLAPIMPLLYLSNSALGQKIGASLAAATALKGLLQMLHTHQLHRVRTRAPRQARRTHPSFWRRY